MSASKAACLRLTKEYKSLQKEPLDLIIAHPSDDNILLWYYVLDGAPGTIYEGGQYLGTLLFSPDYPYSPPAIQMITPHGRFKTNYDLCLTMSNYHPETWNPSWSVGSILVGLQSFMSEDNTVHNGAITNPSDEERLAFAKASKEWNKSNDTFTLEFPNLIFPDLEWE